MTWTARSKALILETLRFSFAPARRPCHSPRCWWRWRASGRKHPPAFLAALKWTRLGVLSHEGCLPQSLEGAYREMAALLRWAAAAAPRLQTICVHSRSWHEAGGHAVQELAFTLATGVEYLREMNQRGLDVETVAPRMRFAVTVGTNFFMEIAKLRALRMLWSRAVAVAGGGEAGPKTLPPCPHLAMEQEHSRSAQQHAARHRRSPGRRSGRVRQHASRRVRRGHPPAGRFQPAHRAQHPAHSAKGMRAGTGD